LRCGNPLTAAFVAVLAFLLAAAAPAARSQNPEEPSKAATVTSPSGPAPGSESSTELVVRLEINNPVSGAADLSDQSGTVGYDSSPEATSLCSIAERYLGAPYRWGGTTPAAFDCSGFTRYVYARLGVRLPRTAREQYRAGDPVKCGTWESGDLIFFDMSKGYVSHVGMYVGSYLFIHASTPTTGVRMDSLKKRAYKKHYVGARRYREV